MIPILPFIPMLGDSHERRRILGPSIEFLKKKYNIWIHALSLGEVLSAIPLINELRREYPQKDIIMSVSTNQGLRISNERLKQMVSRIITMPVDFWIPIHRLINQIEPEIFILIETDIWPGGLSRLKSKGVPICLVNGRVSPRTFRMYMRFKPISSHILNMFDLCLMQSEIDSIRLIKAGADPDKVITTGNIKFEEDISPMGPEEKKRWAELFSLDTNEPVWVAGSTHPGEEEIILKVFKDLRISYPKLRLIIAPRDVRRAQLILGLVSQMGFRGTLRSKLDHTKKIYDVVVLDTIGELTRIYGIGTLAFVGGSLVPIGGHNLLEPAGLGVPVLFGPHTHNFVAMSQMLISAGGGIRVHNEKELLECMLELLGDHGKRNIMGQSGVRFVSSNRGALERVMRYIKKVLWYHAYSPEKGKGPQ